MGFGKQEKQMSEKLTGVQVKDPEAAREELREILESKGMARCFKLHKHLRTIKMPVSGATFL